MTRFSVMPTWGLGKPLALLPRDEEFEGTNALEDNRGSSGSLRLVAYSDAISVGGAEHSLGHLLAHLSERFAVTVMGVRRELVEALAARRPGSGTCIVSPVGGKHDLPAIIHHLQALRRLRPDIFHANLCTPWSCQYGIAAAQMTPGVRVIAVEHLPIPTMSSAQRFLKRAVSLRLARHVAVGQRTARAIEHLVGLPTGSVETIHNGVPVGGGIQPVARASAGPVVGSLARLADHKGFDVLVRALPALPGVTAVLVGDGPERDSLERLASELGVRDRLLVLGWSDEPRRYLTGFDVFVLPSRYEGFPLSIVEAMLAGLPVVAGDVGSVQEAVSHGESGLLVPAGNPPALASALERLLANRGLREHMGRSGQARARREFTVEVMARRFEALYDGVITAHRPAGIGGSV